MLRAIVQQLSDIQSTPGAKGLRLYHHVYTLVCTMFVGRVDTLVHARTADSDSQTSQTLETVLSILNVYYIHVYMFLCVHIIIVVIIPVVTTSRAVLMAWCVACFLNKQLTPP